ncbi:TackOD1 domain-containing metal-binding protein [Denitrificimonas caeni]|uniref:TackOD1 domain-containing metal-binding protein n=1 Tax=Denitrificimonas caeni TaxID=521720 RepID=UPI0003B2F47E|nr:diguanylate cyclase [Denitrificimonas caeni]
MSFQIALISEQPLDSCPSEWRQFNSIAELLNDTSANVVILSLAENVCEQALIMLRQDHRYQFTLIYTLKSQAKPLTLSDGALPTDIATIQKDHATLMQRLAGFNRGRHPEQLEECVMAWLWTRPGASISAQRDTKSAQIYFYPLIHAFANNEPVNQLLWLRLLTEQGLLVSTDLVDRIRLCASCNSSRLNYVDVCPQCKDLDIAKEPALHCFTCGHVAPQESFLKDGLMMCPNCLTRLRHIGSDYDRPLENQSCRACRTSFIDADVHVRCLDCDHAQSPDELRVREIRHYTMTEKARLRCRQGFTEDISREYFNRLNLIGLNDFTYLLDWQLQQARRYPGFPECSLIALQFNGLENALTTPEGQAALDNLVERIKETIRDTDRCSRTREDQLWLLLPHTDYQGAKILGQRLAELLLLLEGDDNSVNSKVAVFTLPGDLLAEENAALLMGRLASEVG